MKPGTKVHYIGNPYKRPENGIIKSKASETEYFVVFSFGEEPGNYMNYTGVRTPVKYLKSGWIKPYNTL